MLHDGTNPEGIDPVPPLEWRSKTDLTDVVLVNSAPSPPCAKLRYHLAHNNVPYSLMSPAEFRKGKKSGVDYVKVPAMFVAGRQVNDSYVITKHLAQALYGGKVDEVWDAKITFGLQLAVEAEGFEDPRDYPVLVTFGGFPAFVGTLFWWALPLKTMARNIRAKRAEKDDKFGPLCPAKQYASEFRAAIGSKLFFGGEALGYIDVSFYATLVMWETVPSVKLLLQEADLETWWKRMKAAMPSSVNGDQGAR